ncbi:hypothetical protein [Propionivibrio sp.]|uniref:GAF domain-containing protein n=1 Tax=Propionivibrio sp. TaxID=2212460 RepID=UPI0025F559C7|nr:hypothetical protein [Propionivibrio sp.]
MLEPSFHSTDIQPNCGYCRTHELNILLLAALYAVSRVLSRSLAFNESLRDVLRILHDEAGLTHAMISVVDPRSGNLTAHVLHHPASIVNVQYQPGEGILGLMLERPRTVMLSRISDEPHFSIVSTSINRGSPSLPAPIKVVKTCKASSPTQPGTPGDGLLEERAQFVEMVANLIGWKPAPVAGVELGKIDRVRRGTCSGVQSATSTVSTAWSAARRRCAVFSTRHVWLPNGTPPYSSVAKPAPARN